MVSPGIQYLVTNFPTIVLPLGALWYATDCLEAYTSVSIPRWAVVLAAGLSLPLYSVVKSAVADFKNRRTAAAMGAVLAPTVRDKWPFNLGILARLIRSFYDGYPGDFLLEVIPKYGQTFYLAAGSDTRLLTMEPHHIKSILATDFESWEKGAIFRDSMNSVLGTGVFNADGEMWKFHRSMTRPFFNKERITDFDIFDRHALDAISQAQQRLKAGFPIDFQDLASRFTLDSATEFLFGQDVRSLSAGFPYPQGSPEATAFDNSHHPSNQFSHAFGEAQRMIAFRSFFGARWRAVEMRKDSTRDHMQKINDYINPILNEAVRRKRELKAMQGDLSHPAEAENMLEHLVNYTEDPVVLRDEILNIMIAGRDTTAATLTFGLYMLSQHPEVLSKLRAEIIGQVGMRRPTYEELRNLKYLRAFINETLRLYPIVPFDLRTSTKATVLPPTTPGQKPFYIPAGTRCLYSVFVMQRRTDLWGPDALEFDPDRFIDERVQKYLTPNPFIFLPFNAGPRICLGQQFAYNEASFMLIRLLQSFSSVELAQDAQPSGTIPPASWALVEGRQSTEKIMPKSHLTMYIDGGLWVRFGDAVEEAKAAV